MEADAGKIASGGKWVYIGSQQKGKTEIPVNKGFRSRCAANAVQRRSPLSKVLAARWWLRAARAALSERQLCGFRSSFGVQSDERGVNCFRPDASRRFNPRAMHPRYGYGEKLCGEEAISHFC
jgi:hypothetical protein